MTDWPVDKIETHREDAIARFTSQYQHAEKLKELAGIFADRVQGMEDAAQQLLQERWVDDAQGRQLDELGLIVGEPRLERSDRVYRDAIRLRIILNSAGGEPESVIQFVDQAFFADRVVLHEIYPAKVEVYVRLGENAPGADVIAEDFILNDGDQLELSDGSTLEVSVLDRDVFSEQVDRIRPILAAGIGALYFTESDVEIAFGTTELNIDQTFELSDGDDLELSDGSLLQIFDASTADAPPDYVAGLGELGVAEFELSLSDDFILELDTGDVLGVTDQVDFIEGQPPRGTLAELFEVA